MKFEGSTSAPADAHAQPVHSQSLSEQAFSFGSKLLQSAEEKVHSAEHYIAEHPRMSTAVGIASAAAVGVIALASRGKAAEISTMAEDALLLSAKDGTSALSRGGELASEASHLMNSSTLRRAAAVGLVPLAALTLAGCEEEQVKAAMYKNAPKTVSSPNSIATKNMQQQKRFMMKRLQNSKTKQIAKIKPALNASKMMHQSHTQT